MRLFVQVLDDSTDERAIALVDQCVDKWSRKSIQIDTIRRPIREGFKADSMQHGMTFMPNAAYIAIFDADFLPTADFLLQTVPTLIQDPLVAFVQARWTFTNAKESFLTRMQEIWLNFHHKCEQEGSYRVSVFFGFNGTGGVWRTSAIEQCGGWQCDTLVEDWDLSLRTHLNGWHSAYMNNVGCLNEISPTFAAFYSQQYRWTCGPMQVPISPPIRSFSISGASIITANDYRVTNGKRYIFPLYGVDGASHVTRCGIHTKRNPYDSTLYPFYEWCVST
ncbi:unnamed protein product [Rotaria sp. Silwood1]|nr:unnamed protein product [Rotaria sp. Silwood1]